MNRENQAKLYIWLAAIFALIIFAAFVDLNRTYKSEVDVLIIPKNESVLKNVSQIADNIKEIPKTLSFYNRIISSGDIFDEAGNLSDYKRKAYWESKIRTKKIDGSSMVKIIVFDRDQDRAEDLSHQAGLEIAKVMSQHYNIKTELDIRIADGPIVSYGLKNNILIIILESIFGGIMAAFLVSVINQILKKMGMKSKSDGMNFSVSAVHKLPIAATGLEIKPISFDKKPSGLEKKQLEVKVDFEKEAVSYGLGKKSAAPDNLPVGDFPEFYSVDMISQKLKADEKEETAEKEEIASEPITREATPEEVKARLNKLLRGEL